MMKKITFNAKSYLRFIKFHLLTRKIVACIPAFTKDYWSKAERAYFKELREDNNLVILPVLNKEDYISKCNDHIDNAPYL